MTQVIAAGVDVGRDWLDVAFAPGGRSFRAPNGAEGVRFIVERLRRQGVSRVVLESIGCYATRLVRGLVEAELPVWVVDPRRIKALRLVEGSRAKTDRLDAKLIARFALLMSEATRPIPGADALELRALSARRRQLVEMIAMEKTRLKQTVDQGIIDGLKSVIGFLSTERARIEAAIATRTRTSEEGRRKEEILLSIPGIGPAVAATLMADLPELGTLDNKAIASLAGLAPHVQQSGTAPARAHIGGGRPCVRTALYMAALGSIRAKVGYRHDYRAMRQAAKPAKVAIIAIARKLVVAANALIKNDRTWTPQTH